MLTEGPAQCKGIATSRVLVILVMLVATGAASFRQDRGDLLHHLLPLANNGWCNNKFTG